MCKKEDQISNQFFLAAGVHLCTLVDQTNRWPRRIEIALDNSDQASESENAEPKSSNENPTEPTRNPARHQVASIWPQEKFYQRTSCKSTISFRALEKKYTPRTRGHPPSAYRGLSHWNLIPSGPIKAGPRTKLMGRMKLGPREPRVAGPHEVCWRHTRHGARRRAATRVWCIFINRKVGKSVH